MQAALISVSIHPNYDHLPRGATKDARREDKRRMGRKAVHGWQRKEWTLEQFAAHLDAERGFAAVFTDGHRHNTSAQAQFVCIDDDQGDPEFYSHVEALGCAAIAGETSTPGHHRAILPLAQAVTDPALYKQLFARVNFHFHGDPAGAVLSQPWLGFRRGTTRIVRGEFLTIAEIMAWPAPPESQRVWRREPDQPMIRLTGDRAEQRASVQKQRIIDEYLTVPGGAGLRHRAFIRLVARLIARREWPGFENIESEIRALGEETERERAEIESAIRSAQQKIAPIPLELPAHKPKKSVRRRLTAPAAHPGAIPVNRVSDDLRRDDIRSAKTLLIQAGTGMGKSWAIYDYLNSLPDDQRVTAVVLFYLLTLALVTNLHGAVHYQDASSRYQGALGVSPRLVSTVSSLYKFNRAGGAVWFDEAEENLEFLACSKTFTPAERMLSYAAFKRLVATADQLIMTSANLSDIIEHWVQTHRSAPITFKRYHPAKSRGKVTFLRDHVAGFCMVDKLLAHGRGQVWTMHSSEAQAADLADRARAQGYQVLKITSDTSQTETVRAAINNQNGERSAYDLVVITTAAGAGVDVSEPVYAKVGFFSARPLAPRQGIQLFGRVRSAQRAYAVAPPDSEGCITPTADELLTDRLKREIWTASKTGMTPHISGDYLELLQLWAQFTALDLKEKTRWRHHFAQRLQAEGFTVIENNARAPEVFAAALDQWRADRQAQKVAFVVGATGQALTDEDIEALRRDGQEITRELKLRNVRFKVNEARGDDAMTPLDEDLIDRAGRAKLYHLRDLLRPEIDLLDEDRKEAIEGTAIQQRRYKALDQRMLSKLLSLAGFKIGSVEQRLLMFAGFFREERSADEVNARFSVFTSEAAMRSFKALGHHGNNANSVTGLCRWLFDHFGLSLKSRQLRSDGTRMMFYQIDLEAFKYRLDRARRAISLSKNVNLEITTTFLDTPTNLSESGKEETRLAAQAEPHQQLLSHTASAEQGGLTFGRSRLCPHKPDQLRPTD